MQSVDSSVGGEAAGWIVLPASFLPANPFLQRSSRLGAGHRLPASIEGQPLIHQQLLFSRFRPGSHSLMPQTPQRQTSRGVSCGFETRER
jgi:hypothetical protein